MEVERAGCLITISLSSDLWRAPRSRGYEPFFRNAPMLNGMRSADEACKGVGVELRDGRVRGGNV